MGQIVGAINGIGQACAALDMPIVSGNVSLYNETDGTGILPTPTIGAVGLIDDLNNAITGTAQPGDIALVIGATKGHLGRSALLSVVFDRDEGTPPPVDLEVERKNGAFILEHAEHLSACTDLSDGGLALAAFEMAEAAGIGVCIDRKKKTASLFGEDQGRYLIACRFDLCEFLMLQANNAGLTVALVGKFGGDEITLGTASAPAEELFDIYRTSFEKSLG